MKVYHRPRWGSHDHGITYPRLLCDPKILADACAAFSDCALTFWIVWVLAQRNTEDQNPVPLWSSSLTGEKPHSLGLGPLCFFGPASAPACSEACKEQRSAAKTRGSRAHDGRLFQSCSPVSPRQARLRAKPTAPWPGRIPETIQHSFIGQRITTPRPLSPRQSQLVSR